MKVLSAEGGGEGSEGSEGSEGTTCEYVTVCGTRDPNFIKHHASILQQVTDYVADMTATATTSTSTTSTSSTTTSTSTSTSAT